MADDDQDQAMAAEIETEADNLQAELSRHEFELILSGPHDRDPAILALHAGAGGTDAQDFAQILLRMYLRWAEKQGYRTEILDSLRGGEAGFKSVTHQHRWPLCLWLSHRRAGRPPPGAAVAL